MVVLILLPSQVCNGFLTVSTWEILISWHFLALFGSFQYLPNLGTHYYKHPALVAQLVERGTSKRYTKVYSCVMPRSTVQIRTGASLLLFNSKRVYNIIRVVGVVSGWRGKPFSSFSLPVPRQLPSRSDHLTR